MTETDFRKSIRWNERVSTLASHLLVSLMLACVMVTLVQFGHYLVPSWRAGYLPWVTLLVSLDAMYTKRAVRGIVLFSLEWVIYRGVEIVVLLLGLKVLLYLIHGPAQLWLDLAGGPVEFFANFFSGEYLIAAGLVLLFWVFAGQFAEDLGELEGDENLLAGNYAVNVSKERRVVRQQLMSRIFTFGIGMVILVTLMRVDLEGILGIRPAMRATIFNVVLYFMLALVLFSQTQFAVLRATWSAERIPQNLNLGTRWVVYSLVFLLGLVILSILLPTSYTLGFLSLLGLLLSWLLFAIAWVWQLLLTILLLLLSLFGIRQSGTRPQPSLPPLPTSSELPTSPGTPPWFELLKSILFWGLFLGVIGFSCYQYLKQHKELWNKIRQLPGVLILDRFWKWLLTLLQGANRALVAAVEAGIQRVQLIRGTAPRGSPWRFISLRRLSARQRVWFYYLAMLRRAGEQGLPRQPYQTPYEYRGTLSSPLADVDQELASMTEAFIEARYSRHKVTQEQAGLAKRWWDRIRHSLRSLRKRGDP
jgi:hypothetical protein